MELTKNNNMHKIIYDIATCPDGVSIEMLIDLYKSSGIVLWDSSKSNGKLSGDKSSYEPKVVIDEDCDIQIKIVDCGK